MTHHFTSPALRELKSAARYYEDECEGLGEEFLDELELAVERVLMFPQAWGRVDENYMHCHLKRFPYTLIYTFLGSEEIVFISVFHQSRHPDILPRVRICDFGKIGS